MMTANQVEQCYTVWILVKGEGEAWDMPCFATSPEDAVKKLVATYRKPVKVQKVIDEAGKCVWSDPASLTRKAY